MPAEIIAGAIGAGGAIGGALIGSSGAESAAQTQAEAAEKATNLQRDMYLQNRADLSPYRTTGATALRQLAYLLGIPEVQSAPGTAPDPGGSLDPYGGMSRVTGRPSPTSPMEAFQESLLRKLYDKLPPEQKSRWDQAVAENMEKSRLEMGGLPLQSDSVAPINKDMGAFGSLTKSFGLEDFQKDPGYEFRLSEGLKALERTAAARTGTLSGPAVKAAARYNQDYASGEFQNAWNRDALNKANLFARVQALAGMGENAAGQTAGLGSVMATQAGQNIIGAGNAGAAATLAGTNTWNNALSSTANNISNLMMLQRMLNQSSYQPLPASATTGVPMLMGDLF